jgi:hypothetical protein
MKKFLTMALLMFMPTLALAQSAKFQSLSVQTDYPPSITVKASPASGYSNVEYQILRNGYWWTVANSSGQGVVNIRINDNSAYKVRIRGVTPSPYKAGDWIEHEDGFRFNIIFGEGNPPAVGPLCIQKTITNKVKINLSVSCSSSGCGEAFGRACSSAGGFVSGTSCYRNETTVLTCT